MVGYSVWRTEYDVRSRQLHRRREEIMAVRGTPEEIAEKWQRRTGAAGQDWQRGVERVTEAPTAKAAAAADLWQQKLTSPDAKEKFKRNVGRVSTEQWKAATVAASGRFTSGAQAAAEKMARHQAEVRAHIEAGQRQLATMPKGTPQDAANRASFWVLHMAKYKRPV